MPSTTTTARRRRAVAVLAAGALLSAGVVACGDASSSPAAGPAVAASTSAAVGVVGVRDPWVKAADTGMTAAFGTLVNETDTDVTITGAATEVSPMELHEMTMKDGKMVMRAKPGGIVIKARSTHVLEPGGDHLMLMNVRQPVRAGDELAVTLTFADGRNQTFTAVAKPFTGAQESYAPGHGASPMPETSMSPAA
ncbi:copper chaperone PCu(A)C [Micromonospora sp. ALFpr18c]|uniref:copper chaperone PCu(A)C n=1 Tax=unclassified Micromonospora TaxID=2617518 RepID=UPI00124B9379|nr:copper chaperone PCu(A)C [Micromonospora sp. ALFpr18c]KAB1930630.1 copper chaperone PCu(A)C [Micromonospora sp. ALFpr18c]